MRKRRIFSAEYKAEAVQLVESSDKPLSQIARDLGINPNMLGRWRKEFREGKKTAFPGQGNPRDEEIARLKKELRQVKQERDFLKEAAAYFAKDPK
jgi:transposase